MLLYCFEYFVICISALLIYFKTICHTWLEKFNTVEVFCGCWHTGSILYKICISRGNKMPTRCKRWFLLQILLLAQHVSGTTMPIIRSSRVLYRFLLSVVFGALVFSSSSPQTGHITLSQNHTKATDNLCNEKRQSYRGKYKTAPDCKAVPVPNYALAAASGAVPPRITPALDHCQRSASCPKKRFLRHATNRKLVGGDTASYPWRGSSHHKCSVIRSFAKHNTDWLFRFNNSHSWHSQDRASLYILIINANETHYFSDLFDRVLYMIRTGPLSIIWSISTLYTRNRYLSC